jgi:hypothetical protein
MPRGGRRVGAGRKPGKRGVVLGMDGRRRGELAASAPPSPEDVELLVPPADLTEPQREWWRRWAPAALEQRTLVAATLAGFRELCKQGAMAEAYDREISRVGPTTIEGESLTKTYIKLAQRLDSTLARFKLTGAGKPETSVKPRQSASNPWAQVGGQ